VTFVPTVEGPDDVELFVEPEVSEPDYLHAVQLYGFTVPAFITRRARTLVRLKNGQTLIIAGLNLNEKRAKVQKVPYLGDLPDAGSLLSQYQLRKHVNRSGDERHSSSSDSAAFRRPGVPADVQAAADDRRD
jgi:pilus assembly protein CpaC